MMVIQSNPLRVINMQLPSPISPSTQRSPISPLSFTLVASSSRPGSDSGSLNANSRSNLVPIRGFVHEVLRRSRTSGSILQTALCYLEAVRSKVPELVRREQSGHGIRGEPDLADRIVQGEIDSDHDTSGDTHDDADRLIESDNGSVMDYLPFLGITTMTTLNPISATSRPVSASNPTTLMQDLLKRPKPPSPPLPALPPLPSPLLCPQRAFLAFLILASKFMQDKCYSNHAWAKLSGLPPHEISCCECAPGDALDWRLWVGKSPSSGLSAPGSSVQSAHGNIRTVVRSHSNRDLFAGSKIGSARTWQRQQPTVDLWTLTTTADIQGTRNGLL